MIDTRDYHVGEKVYYVPDMFSAIKGTVTKVFRKGSFCTVSIITDIGLTITDTSNKFCFGYPDVLNYWKEN